MDAGDRHKIDTFVSVVILSADDLDVLNHVPDIAARLDKDFSDYEVIIVDRKSGPAVHRTVDEMLREVKGVRFIALSTKVEEEVALGAGMENAIGDFVVLFHPGLDPVSGIRATVEMCREGIDIIIGVSPRKRSTAYRLARPLVQSLLSGIGYDVPALATNMRCVSRRAVNTVTRTGRFRHKFFVRLQKTGYPFDVYPYEQKP